MCDVFTGPTLFLDYYIKTKEKVLIPMYKNVEVLTEMQIQCQTNNTHSKDWGAQKWEMFQKRTNDCKMLKHMTCKCTRSDPQTDTTDSTNKLQINVNQLTTHVLDQVLFYQLAKNDTIVLN